MPLSRRQFLQATAANAALLSAAGELASSAAESPSKARSKPSSRADVSPAAFEPHWESLQAYACPEWFRDAKFGIWAHWTAQCVPEMGDWYARHMYEEGSEDYKFHVAHYGHPSQFGFKDIDHLWHAENWNPDALMELYKAAGAQYFVALANHHDNLDCYASTHQPWNSTRVGPMKDIVGTWSASARRAGLRFGVSCHASHAWNWLEVAQGADKHGPLAGVPYDGKITQAEGAGKWWQGLDPQDLYAQNHTPGRSLDWDWNAAQGSSVPDAAYCEKFYQRTLELVDKYQPDLLYFDDTVLPLYQVSDVGLRIVAHYYNANRKWHNGRLDAVVNGKQLDETQRRALVWDLERNSSNAIQPLPWQTDTCIGDWHYRRSLFENHRYKTATQVIRMLADIVSKNGNLLLSIPLRGDGTLDPDEHRFLTEMVAWMKVNNEAIFGTRPWQLAGEGTFIKRGNGFNEGGEEHLGATDFRFTTRGDTLYAIAFGWPTQGQSVVRTLARGAAGIVGQVKRVQLLGHHGDLPFQRTEEGLVITLPRVPSGAHAWVLKIEGLHLAASQPVAPPPPLPNLVRPDAQGTLTLMPADAQLTGKLALEHHGTISNIGFWDNPQDTATWHVHFNSPGTYRVTAQTAAAGGATAFGFALKAATSKAPGTALPLTVAVPPTGDWATFQTIIAEGFEVPAAGDFLLTVRPANPATWHALNLGTLTLQPQHN